MFKWSDSSLDPIAINCISENEGCNIGTNTNNVVEDKIVPGLGRKKRNKNNKNKKLKI